MRRSTWTLFLEVGHTPQGMHALNLFTRFTCTVRLAACLALPSGSNAGQAFYGSTLKCYPAPCCNDAGAKNTSEHFNTAGRSVKTGLIAVDVVSHWTWSVSVSLIIDNVSAPAFHGCSPEA